jgi:hypothetical protein
MQDKRIRRAGGPKMGKHLLCFFLAVNIASGFKTTTICPKLMPNSKNFCRYSITARKRLPFQPRGLLICAAADSCSERCSTLTDAVKNANYSLVDQLLKQGKDSNSFDEWGVASLQVAIKKGYDDIAELLILNGADVNKSDIDGDTTTPLHTAAQGGHLEIVKLLVQKGAGLHFGILVASSWLYG